MSRDRDYEWRKYFTCPRCFNKNARVVIILAKKDSPSTPPSWLPEDFVYPEDSCDPAVGLVCENNHFSQLKEPYFARVNKENTKGNAGRCYILSWGWEFDKDCLDRSSTIFLAFVDEAIPIMVRYGEADLNNVVVRSMLQNDYRSEVSRSTFVDSSVGSSISSKWTRTSHFTSVSKQRPRNFNHSPQSFGDCSQKVKSWLEDNNNAHDAERPLQDTDSRSSFTLYSHYLEPTLSEESDCEFESESDPLENVSCSQACQNCLKKNVTDRGTSTEDLCNISPTENMSKKLFYYLLQMLFFFACLALFKLYLTDKLIFQPFPVKPKHRLFL